MCHIQEQQLLTDSVLELSPIVVKSCAGHNSYTLSDIFMILHQFVEELSRHVMYTKDKSDSIF